MDFGERPILFRLAVMFTTVQYGMELRLYQHSQKRKLDAYRAMQFRGRILLIRCASDARDVKMT